MEFADLASERIKRMRKRYLEELSIVSIERAKYYTEKWTETESSDFPLGVRVALCMKHVYENVNLCIDPDDRIAGTWTENFVGVPLDIERGLFNDTMEIEWDRFSMLLFLLKSNVKFLSYMIRKYGFRNFYENVKQSREVGAAMPSIGTKPMDKREINPYGIDPKDKKILQKELLPYWKGKTATDIFREELAESNINTGDIRSFVAALPATTSKNDTIISTGAALGTWQGHLIIDHETPMRKGVVAMREEVHEQLSDAALTKEESAFLTSIDLALEGVIIFAKRLAEKLEEELGKKTDPERKQILGKMLKDCRKVPFYPPETFSQAVQSYWTVKTAVEIAMPFNVHAPGRLDQLFYPYYKKDLEEGRITHGEARELLEELFLKIMSHNMRPYSNFTGYFAQRYEGSEPVTFGGLTKDGKDATNELTYVMLDAAERSKAALNFAVRFHKNSPEELFMRVADLHHSGTSSVSMMNDEISMEALKKRGFTDEDARGYAITGCVDMCAPGKTGGEGFSAILLCRTLDMTLRNGESKTLVGLIKDVGLKTGDPDTFTSFDQLVDAFVVQAKHQLKKIVDASKIRDRIYAENLPCPAISAFMQGCLEKKKDVTQGGGIYDLEGILFMSSIANVVDSLFVMKKLIFEDNKFTFKELIEATDHNFVGYEDMLKMILDVDGKWGNGNVESDELARRITSELFEETYKYQTYKGGKFAPFINSMTAHTYDGRVCIATPDGRRAAKPFAASCNPYNVDTHGPTGVLRSVAALDFSHVLGCAVNIRMHPSAIGKTEETRKKWVSLVKSYFQMGGVQLQPTVVSTETLRAAQKDPENYQSVIVKVGGYSAYFVDLGYEIQEEIIARSEHRMV